MRTGPGAVALGAAAVLTALAAGLGAPQQATAAPAAQASASASVPVPEVPDPAPALAAPSAPAPALLAEACFARTGPYQRQMEGYLGRPVDGSQSTADCEAIRQFQSDNGIDPADGYASLGTYRWTVALQARDDPNAEGRCPVRSYRVTCVDLDRQLLWVQQEETILYTPVPIRTGRDTEETRLGWHTIYWRSRDHVSTIYDDAPMPFAQFFDGGQALHGRLDDLYDGGGSAGCVNMRLSDAEELWDLLALDDQLYIWGVKPGTDG